MTPTAIYLVKCHTSSQEPEVLEYQVHMLSNEQNRNGVQDTVIDLFSSLKDFPNYPK